MRFIKNYFRRRTLDRIRQDSYVPQNLKAVLFDMSVYYQSLSEKERVGLWYMGYNHCMLPCSSLQALVLSTEGIHDWESQCPMEWLTGSTKGEMLEYMTTPDLVYLAAIRELVWVRVYMNNFGGVGEADAVQACTAMRTILEVWKACL